MSPSSRGPQRFLGIFWAALPGVGSLQHEQKAAPARIPEDVPDITQLRVVLFLHVHHRGDLG